LWFLLLQKEWKAKRIIMTLIFWQGIISIHQKTFLEALVKQPTVKKVMMIAENAITPYRQNMGWEVPEIVGAEVIIAPSHSQIKQIFSDNKDAVHILGGIRVGKMMTLALEEGAKQKAKMGSLSEPYDRSGFKGILRDLKYRYLKLFYFKHIDFFLAVGRDGVNTYTRLGFNPQRVFPWAYFVSVAIATKEVQQTAGKGINIIYAGRIEEGKGIYRFVQQLAQTGNKNYSLHIYGGGPQEEILKQYVQENGLTHQITFFPFLPYNELVKQYARYDWVVLPSQKKDGWGVIVSEGLLNGLKGICSNICGVSWAIKDNYNGLTFNWAQEGDCKEAISKMLENKGFANADEIKTWAHNALSGEAGAAYYLKIIDCVYNAKSKPAIPWVDN